LKTLVRCFISHNATFTIDTKATNKYLDYLPLQKLILIQEMQLAPVEQVRSCLAPVTFTHLLTTSLHALSLGTFRNG
jgi:hypothetical protein